MTQPQPDYHAWVLRLWRENSLNAWRIALENVTTQERKGFADLNELVAYLQVFCVPEAINLSAAAGDRPEVPQFSAGDG